jgi:TonB family protein
LNLQLSLENPPYTVDVKSLFLSLALVGLLARLGMSSAQQPSEQTRPSADAATTGVALTKSFPPIYPPLARQARIAGDVKIEVSIRNDGSVESATVVEGPAMLRDPALDSAKKSLFECRGCAQSETAYLLTYTFEIKNQGDHCDALSRPAEISYSADHIAVVAPAQWICDPAEAFRRYRSPKCLYLWKCGKDWFQ